jgi:hypothetical protein
MAFGSSDSITSMTVDSNNIVYDSRDNCNAIIRTNNNALLYGCNNTVIPNTVTSIGGYAFNNYINLTSINIPSSVYTLNENSFYGCYGLTSITVDSNNTVYDSRDNCNAIINTSSNKLIFGCNSTVIPNTVTSIGNYAFYRCSGLTNVTIPGGVTSIGDSAFRECTSLTRITSNATTAPTIQFNTFQGVKTGGTLTVPSGSSGYDVWMGTGNYYLGLYNWIKVEQ